MKIVDLIRSAVAQTFRSKVRTTLTILAIFVGAFTLVLTNGLGTGINNYIDDTLSSIGASDVMTVTKPSDAAGVGSGEPTEYDPDAIEAGPNAVPGSAVIALGPADIDALGDVEGVLKVEPTLSISADYIQYDGGKQYVVGVGSLVPGQTVQLSEGTEPDNSASAYQIALPDPLV